MKCFNLLKLNRSFDTLAYLSFSFDFFLKSGFLHCCAQKNLKGFSLSLFNFQGSFCTLLSSRSLECLHIISNSNQFVNTFFQIFLKIFKLFFRRQKFTICSAKYSTNHNFLVHNFEENVYKTETAKNTIKNYK